MRAANRRPRVPARPMPDPRTDAERAAQESVTHALAKLDDAFAQIVRDVAKRARKEARP